MTSVLRIRRRHRLPEGNLGLSKPSCDEKAGAGNFLLLGESVTASAQNVAPVVTTPIAPFLLAGRRARLISPRRFPIRTRRMRCSWACRFPQASASSLSPRRAAQTSHGWQFSELRKFRAVFRDRRDVGQGGGFIGMVGSAEPAVLVTLRNGELHCPLSGELGQCLPGSLYSRSIRNRIITL